MRPGPKAWPRIVSAWGRSSSAGGIYTLISWDSNWNEVGLHTDVGFSGTGSWQGVATNYVPARVGQLGVRMTF